MGVRVPPGPPFEINNLALRHPADPGSGQQFGQQLNGRPARKPARRGGAKTRVRNQWIDPKAATLKNGRSLVGGLRKRRPIFAIPSETGRVGGDFAVEHPAAMRQVRTLARWISTIRTPIAGASAVRASEPMPMARSQEATALIYHQAGQAYPILSGDRQNWTGGDRQNCTTSA